MTLVKQPITVVIPTIIIEIIEAAGYTKTIKSRMYRLVDLLLGKQLNSKNINGFVPLSAKYLQVVICKNYERVITPLLTLAIIERDDSYSTKTHMPKKYRVNRQYISNQVQRVSCFNESNRDAINLDDDDDDINRICEYSLNVMRNLVTFEEGVIEWIKDYCQPHIVAKRCPKVINIMENQEKSWVSIQYNFNEEKHWRQLKTAFRKAESITGSSLIHLKDNHYMIMDYSAFLQAKSAQLMISYINYFIRLKEKRLYATRNKTNNRLDTNFTNLPSAFLPFCRLDADRLSAIDLKNAQMVLFASLIDQGFFDQYL